MIFVISIIELVYMVIFSPNGAFLDFDPIWAWSHPLAVPWYTIGMVPTLVPTLVPTFREWYLLYLLCRYQENNGRGFSMGETIGMFLAFLEGSRSFDVILNNRIIGTIGMLLNTIGMFLITIGMFLKRNTFLNNRLG